MLDLHHRAVAVAQAAVARVTPADLGRPTPCAAWDVGALLRHMVGENQGFATAAAHGRAGLAVWAGGDVGADPGAAFAASAAAAVAALREADGRLLEIREFGTFPARVAIGMQVVDLVVHGWDVAVSVGAPYAPDDDLAAAALAIAGRWPIPPEARGPEAAFDRQVPTGERAGDLDRLLGLVGRDPAWTPGRGAAARAGGAAAR